MMIEGMRGEGKNKAVQMFFWTACSKKGRIWVDLYGIAASVCSNWLLYKSA